MRDDHMGLDGKGKHKGRHISGSDIICCLAKLPCHVAEHFCVCLFHHGTGEAQELLGFVARRQHSQILVKQLEKKKLVRSALGLRFHLRDLLGSGSIRQLQTPSGALVRVAKKN